MINTTRKKIAFVTFALLFIYAPTVVAQSTFGVVEGTMKFFNVLGHYCPNDGSRSCAGSNYNEADFGKYQPVRDMRVHVYVDGSYGGQGTTDQFGNYEISWYSYSSNPSNILLRVFFQHKDNRFFVRDSDGSLHYMYGSTNIIPGTTVSNPQNLGTWKWGTANAPIKIANTYEAIWRTWRYAFQYSNRLVNNFTNLTALNQTTGSSSFDSNSFTLKVAEVNQYDYSTIQHEMGHAASMKASLGQTFLPPNSPQNVYCYPDMAPVPPATSCGWSSDGQQWGFAQFEEGLATFLGQVGAFWSSSHDPIRCALNPSVPCPSTNQFFDMETSLFSACTTSDARTPSNVTKYLRDLYDEGDTVDLSFSQMVDGIYAFTNSTSNGGKYEHWSYFVGQLLDDFDGRSAEDFRRHIQSTSGISASANAYLYNANCNPVGD